MAKAQGSSSTSMGHRLVIRALRKQAEQETSPQMGKDKLAFADRAEAAMQRKG